MISIDHMISAKDNDEDLYLADSKKTHTILKDKKYFLNLILVETNVNTIPGIANFIGGYKRAHILLPDDTKF
ncbi:hypothetical protein Q8G71_37140, partial [Klebsiella pneumoniae]